MFRRSKHYVLAAPMECVLIDGHRFLSGAVINMSLYGAFVATESGHSVHLDEGAIVWLSTRLEDPRKPVLNFALDRGALVWSNTGRRTPDPILETRARVAWCNYGPQRLVIDLAEGVGLDFTSGERVLGSRTAMISELQCRNFVKNDASWLSQTPAARVAR